MSAGYCVFDSGSGTVTCTQPSVTLNKLPAFCNLAFESAASVTVRTVLDSQHRNFRNQAARFRPGMPRR